MVNQDVHVVDHLIFNRVECVDELILENEKAQETKVDNELSETNADSPDFRLYQFVLYVMTQAGYFAVAGSMLSATFLEPSKNTCNLISQFRLNHQNRRPTELSAGQSADEEDYESFRRRALSTEFHSLAVEWREECGVRKAHSNFLILAPAVLMTGAILGSFVTGFLADRFGRKPVVVGSLLVVCLANAAISILGDFYSEATNSAHYTLFSWWRHFWAQNSPVRFVAVFGAMFVLGAACGGYMVTNVVFLVEALHNSARLRLLVVALNGWPLGMIFAALVGAFSAHWRIYHLIMSASAILVVTLLEIFSLESFHWHYYRGDHHLAAKVHSNIQKRYTKSGNFRNLTPSLTDMKLGEMAKKEKVSYSYLDLFRHSNIFIPLAQLSYCFFSASVVSYGLFFSVDSLPGNRYTNLAVMGVGKLALGFASFLISFRVGRRPIMITSLSIACILCWILVTLLHVKNTTEVDNDQQQQIAENISILVANSTASFQEKGSPSYFSLVTWLALALTAILDPTWKANHLFSMELFPIQVRNMSRGLCNVAARIGSMAGPLVIYMRSVDESYPFWMFLILLSFQWIVSLTLPETKDRDLLREMPRKTEKLVAMKALIINESNPLSNIDDYRHKIPEKGHLKTTEKGSVEGDYTENRHSG